MARKLDSKGDPINRNRRAALSASASVNPDGNPYVDAGITPPTEDEKLAYCIHFFVEHDDGYLKMRRSLDTDDLHLVWEWSAGKYRGSYVYVVKPFYEVYEGLDLLVTKVLEVEHGMRKPTPDKRSTSYK